MFLFNLQTRDGECGFISFSRSTPGVTVPPLNTHPEVYNFKDGRLAVPFEYLCMQGVDALPSFTSKREISPMVEMFKKLKESKVKILAGNGIHIPTFSAIFLYMLGNCTRHEFIVDVE